MVDGFVCSLRHDLVVLAVRDTAAIDFGTDLTSRPLLVNGLWWYNWYHACAEEDHRCAVVPAIEFPGLWLSSGKVVLRRFRVGKISIDRATGKVLGPL